MTKIKNLTVTQLLDNVCAELETVLTLITDRYEYRFGTVEMDFYGDIVIVFEIKALRGRDTFHEQLLSIREMDLIDDIPLSQCSKVDWHKSREDLDTLQTLYKNYLEGIEYND